MTMERAMELARAAQGSAILPYAVRKRFAVAILAAADEGDRFLLALQAIKALTPSHRAPSHGAPGCWCPEYQAIDTSGHTRACLLAKAVLEIAKAEGKS